MTERRRRPRRGPLEETAAALAGHGERYGDLAPKRRAARCCHEPRACTPIVLDTDIGGDPDDAVALVVAALHLPELALVVTCDEHMGARARFARHLLDACGRSQVPVIAGTTLAKPGPIVVEHLIPASVPAQPGDLSVVADVCRAASERVRWVGLGPASNLAALLTIDPELVDRLDITLMGGAINYRNPERAEHNVRLDVAAMRTVLATAPRPKLVLSDVTFHHGIEITAESHLYRWLAEPSAPIWARLLRAHMDAWFAGFYPGTMQHDPLTLSTALHLPFVDLGLERIGIDELGRMRYHDEGYEVFLSYRANYSTFNAWLDHQLRQR